MEVIWLAPNLNHYKARFLNRWAENSKIKLSVLCGCGHEHLGHVELKGNWAFNKVQMGVSKSRFAFSKLVYKELWTRVKNVDWVMLPVEKKNIPLLFYLILLKTVRGNFRIFSYNHPLTKSKLNVVSHFDRIITKFFFKLIDRVIFYTEESYHFSIKKRIIKPEKAYWANNTLDSIEICRSPLGLPNVKRPTILFIGRLIPSKKIDVLIDVFAKLKQVISNLKLEIVGDGPDGNLVEIHAKQDSNIIWHGSIVDELMLMPIMERAWLVFVPGHSGLSINHALLYGRPYVTLTGVDHAPEIAYIRDGVNGFLLEPELESLVESLYDLMTDYRRIEHLCRAAKKSSRQITVEHWISQINMALSN